MASNEKRIRVLNEILLTEASFNADLHAVVDVFLVPLRASKSSIIDDQDVRTIFGDWEVILKTSDMLYDDLTKAIENCQSMAAVFIKYAPYLRAYAPYLNNYEAGIKRKVELASLSSLNESNGGNPFREFLDAAIRDPRCHGLDLASFLIMPVQRVPRYKLLLESLLSETAKDHAEYSTVIKAVDAVSEVAKQNNEGMSHTTAFDALMEIQLRFDDQTKLNLLDNPARVLLKEGDLEKQARRGRQVRHFWLFTDKLVYGQVKGGASNPVFEARYILHLDIDLQHCEVGDAEVADDRSRAFLVASTKKSFIVWAKTDVEAQEWRSLLNSTIAALRSERGASTATHAVGELAPRWVPDAAVPACMTCGEVFVSMASVVGKRRHHCRLCGSAVCSSCSKQRIFLRHIDDRKSVRVCDPCVERRQQQDRNEDEDCHKTKLEGIDTKEQLRTPSDKNRRPSTKWTQIVKSSRRLSSQSASSFARLTAFEDEEMRCNANGNLAGAENLAKEAKSPFLLRLMALSVNFNEFHREMDSEATKVRGALVDRLREDGSTGLYPRTPPPLFRPQAPFAPARNKSALTMPSASTGARKPPPPPPKKKKKLQQ